MRARKLPRPLARCWLFTDDRLDEAALLAAIRRVPRGGGVVFRHYALARRARIALARRVAGACRARGLTLLVAGPPLPVRADGAHAPRWMRGRAASRSVHDAAEAVRARGAAAAFVSPVLPTRSHPGAPTLGRWGFARLAALARVPAVALGGMDARSVGRVPRAYGFAGVDCWTGRPASASSARLTSTESS